MSNGNNVKAKSYYFEISHPAHLYNFVKQLTNIKSINLVPW